MTTKSSSSKIGLIALSLTAFMMMIPIISSAEAATLCTDTGADESPRCYATANYTPKSPYVHDGFSVHQTFVNESPSNGFIQDSLWVIFDDSTILEAGINDPQSTGAAKFVTAVDGATTVSSGTPSNNVAYWMYVMDPNYDDVWTMYSHTTSDTENVGSAEAYNAKVGSEAVYTNAPNFNTDHDSMTMLWNGDWVSLSTSNVYQGTTTSTGYYVDKCGSGSENFYHINTGKGSVPNC